MTPPVLRIIDSGDCDTPGTKDYWFRWLSYAQYQGLLIQVTVTSPVPRIIDAVTSNHCPTLHPSVLYPDFYDLNYTYFVKRYCISWSFHFISVSLWEKIQVFWGVMPLRLVTSSSETSVTFHQPTGCDQTEGLNLHQHSHENHKYRIRTENFAWAKC